MNFDPGSVACICRMAAGMVPSFSPARNSSGLVTGLAAEQKSWSARADAHPMKPLTGVVRIICRIFARCGGFAATVSGGNQRAMVESTSAVIPCVRAMAMRSSHCWADAGVDAQGESAHDHAVEPLRMALRKHPSRLRRRVKGRRSEFAQR